MNYASFGHLLGRLGPPSEIYRFLDTLEGSKYAYDVLSSNNVVKLRV